MWAAGPRFGQKIRDIYKLAVDYDPNAEETIEFSKGDVDPGTSHREGGLTKSHSGFADSLQRKKRTIKNTVQGLTICFRGCRVESSKKKTGSSGASPSMPTPRRGELEGKESRTIELDRTQRPGHKMGMPPNWSRSHESR
ncbi:MAG: hypothetical protein JXR37_29630 [Kiritimatiellae bacterium]|nr:hypothetical protein [Kiritimatiellia bacterium]